jgi:hypothetical protein
VAKAIAIGLLWCLMTAAAFAADTPTQVIVLHEPFGVSHPRQIVELTLNKSVDKPAPNFGELLDESGTPVQFQLIDGGKKIAVRSDLPANATKTWNWFARESKPASGVGVRLSVLSETIEISNEFIAVRVPSAGAITKSAGEPGQSSLKPLVDLFNYGPHGQDSPRTYALAPIQGVRLRDGTWTALGPNAVVALARKLTGAKVDVLESGPLKAVVRVRYEFDKPAYHYGSTKISDAGPGRSVVTIALFAGEPSILFEEETDMEAVWSGNFYLGLQPDQARYAGHSAEAVRFGRQPDGAVYAAAHQRQGLDATVDLKFDRARLPSYNTTDDSYIYLAVWNPWIRNGGWYWQLYNSTAGARANLVGIFAGPVSRAVDPGMSGAGIFTLPGGAGAMSKPVMGVSSQSYRRSPDGSIHPISRYDWGLFLGVKGEDLLDPAATQTINKQMNLFSGPVNLTKLAAMKLDFADPPQGYGRLYMDKAALDDVIRRVRESAKGEGDGAYRWLYGAEPTSRQLFDAWADPSGAKMKAAAASICKTATDLVQNMVHERGIYALRFHYWHGGLEMMRQGLWIDQVLASDALSPEERAKVKAAASLFAHVLWDNNFVPLDNWKGFNLGTANMPVQQAGYRDFYALLLANHPNFKDRAAAVAKSMADRVAGQINELGAHMGCPHYIGASFNPTLNSLMQIKQLGPDDPFKTDPRLAKFAEFYLNLMTPPEARFPDKERRFIALGDGSTEPSHLYGQLGTAFRDADPALSKRLMGAWRYNGKPHSGFFGTSVMQIDERLPASDPALTSATFPGYYSVLRSGYGTPDETAAWVVNGGFYSDHRHADAGSIVLYALGVPLCVNWSAMYTPQTPGAYYHSSVVPESMIGQAWDRASPPTSSGRSAWVQSTQSGFMTTPALDAVDSHFSAESLSWTRQLRLFHTDAAMPVIVMRDDFEGRDKDAPKVLTLNLLAKGAVQIPGGSVEPEERTAPYKEKLEPGELASAGRVFPLAPGVSTLSFTGQLGVDFDVFIISKTSQEAFIGNWAISAAQQAPREFRERQHVLRVRGNGPFEVVIVPFRAGKRPAGLAVETTADGTVLVRDGVTLKLNR